MAKRMKRDERKSEILRVLRENTDKGGKPLTCRKIAQRMNLSNYSYVNKLLCEMCDDAILCVDVHHSNKSVSKVSFKYYV